MEGRESEVRSDHTIALVPRACRASSSFSCLTMSLIPLTSWVSSCTSSWLYTLVHLGWWFIFSARSATRDMTPKQALKSSNTNDFEINAESERFDQPTRPAREPSSAAPVNFVARCGGATKEEKERVAPRTPPEQQRQERGCDDTAATQRAQLHRAQVQRAHPHERECTIAGRAAVAASEEKAAAERGTVQTARGARRTAVAEEEAEDRLPTAVVCARR